MKRASSLKLRRCLHGIVWMALTTFAAQPGFAQVAVNPAPSLPSAVSGSAMAQTAAGLTITVDSTWLDGPGYRPVRITVTPAANVAADRDLLIRITTDRIYFSNDPLIVTEQYLSVPSGTPAGQAIAATVSVPPSSIWSDCSIEIIDPSTPKGTVYKQMQFKGMGNRLGTNGLDVVLSKYPHILFVGNAVPDTAAITALMPPVQGNMQGGYVGSTGWGGMPVAAQAVPAQKDASQTIPDIPMPTVINFSASALPERWIDYTSLDIVCLSMDQLADLASNHPAAYRAIMDWTQAGGNLWVYGVEGDKGGWDRLTELEQLLGLETATGRENTEFEERGWSKPSGTAAELQIPSSAIPPDPYADTYQPPGSQPTTITMIPGSAAPPLLLREYGMGTVAAIASADPFAGKQPWTVSDWAWLFSSTGQGRWQWNLRHGLNVGQPSADFWNFLIPGVGFAPVRTFQVFITLFVLGIGPLNYWLLRRRKRLHLMVLTVPLSAALVTAMLFGYALVADGLGTRVRVRSVTRLDARRGEAVTWARLSYYAGIAPSQGLQFSPRTAVYPILDKPEMDAGGNRKKMIWEDDQRLVQGWLDSRTPTQYLTVRSGPSSCRLDIAKSSAKKAALTVENRLGTALDQLAICGRDGKYYLAKNVGAGAKAEANETTFEKISSMLAAAYGQNQPGFPDGVDPRDMRNSAFGRSRYFWYYRNLEEVAMSSSLMERRMEKCVTLSGFDTIPVLGFFPLAPGSYVALTEKLPEIELGTKSAREEASFHVILGEW
ncbi:MAG: hypothetical protein IT426_17620 [Pirellulales bacterium]|nr:hypothetical protein [Pirellulales bacterium]